VTPAALLAEVRARGVEVSPTGRGTIRVRPLSKLPPELMEALRAHKPEILELLAAGQAHRRTAAYRDTLGALWALNLPGATVDREQIRRLLDAQARQCDELGPAFGEAVSGQAARAWAERERHCPYCGMANVYHDPDTGEEITLEPAPDATAGPLATLDGGGWPVALPDLGARRAGPLAPCSTCGAGTWAVFGDTPLCRRCARARGGHDRG
jgi:hypothetical protein